MQSTERCAKSPGDKAGSTPPTGDQVAVVCSVVVPSWNSLEFLALTVPAMLSAVRAHGRAELIIVDNGSTDGTAEYIQEHHPTCKVISVERTTIGAARNAGTRAASGRIFAFIDADCLMDENHLVAAERVLKTEGVSLTGSRYSLPANPGWIEQAWHQLHAARSEGRVRMLGGGNLVVTRDAFLQVGGFDEALATGEDAEFCQRLAAHGYWAYASDSVRVAHLGNPKTVSEFIRREVWYGLGMFGTMRQRLLDRPVLMMLTHLLLTALCVGIIAFGAQPLWIKAVIVVLCQALVPAASVFYRLHAGILTQGKTAKTVMIGLVLYWFYYWARIGSLLLIVMGMHTVFNKRRNS